MGKGAEALVLANGILERETNLPNNEPAQTPRVLGWKGPEGLFGPTPARQDKKVNLTPNHAANEWWSQDPKTQEDTTFWGKETWHIWCS